jgi:hypothetical protein
MAQNHPFPSHALFWRYVLDTERRFGTFPMLIVTPVVIAVSAATAAAEFPAREVVRGHDVIVASSLVDILWIAALGALAGTLLAGLIALLLSVGSYNKLRGWRDPNWEFKWLPEHAEPDPQGMQRPVAHSLILGSRTWPATNSSALGTIFAVVVDPAGGRSNSQADRVHDAWFGSRYFLPPPTRQGEYQVRWYAAARRGRQQEIARGLFTVP